MSLNHFYLLIVLAAIWGSSFTFIKIAVDDFGAIPLMSVRIGIAALFLMVVSVVQKRSHIFSLRYLIANKLLWTLTIAGIVGQTIPFTLIAFAEHKVSAGDASIINATTPFWSAIIAFVWLKKELTVWQILGMTIGFLGVFYLLNAYSSSATEPETLSQSTLLYSLMILVATFAYGLGANYLKRYLNHVHPLDVATGSTLAAALSSIPFALLSWPSDTISHDAWLSILILGVLCTGVAYLMFFYLIAKVDATSAVSVTFLIPIFGVLWGWLFLNEHVNMTTFIAVAMIIVGIVLSNQLVKPKTSRLRR